MYIVYYTVKYTVCYTVIYHHVSVITNSVSDPDQNRMMFCDLFLQESNQKRTVEITTVY